jgi:DNA-binding transcriptional ArsR family regulator
MGGKVVQIHGRAELEAQTASLWRALADPTRRQILDLLTERSRNTGEIASHFAISRIAVMRHLEVLAAAEVVTSRKRGRERWHYINAVQFQRLHERWTTPASAGFASSLLRLQDRAAADVERPAIDVALDVTIAGPPKEVFAALTDDIGGWWGYPAVDSRALSVSLDASLGGDFVEHWDDGGQLIATVTGLAAHHHLTMTGPFHLGLAVGVATFDLTEIADGTLLRFTFRAFGAIDPTKAEGMGSGWKELVGRQLKALVETGRRMGIDGEKTTNVHAIEENLPREQAQGRRSP